MLRILLLLRSRKLNLEKTFDLFLQISEWILAVDFSIFRQELSSKSEDFERLVTFLLDDSLRCPQFDNHSFVKQLLQRISYYHQTKWRYAYLPNFWVVNRGFFKRQLGYLYKSVFGLSFYRK